MDNKELFLFLRYLDEPKRIIGLTWDDCFIGGFTMLLILCSSCKILIALAGFGIRSVVKKVRKGHAPSYLLLLMYWYFPHAMTRIFLKELPPSHRRYWVS